MKKLVLYSLLTGLLTLSACGEVSSDANDPNSVKAKAEHVEAKVTADLSKMDLPEIIDFVNDEATNMQDLLKSVTDGPSAEAAVEEIRNIVPRFNAAIRSLEDADPENMTLSIGNMRKMLKVAQSQAGLFEEVRRISQIPEAREVLEKEFDKIELSNL